MKPSSRHISGNRQGSALILSLVFVSVLSALAVAMAAMSGTNVQIAENQRKVGTTLACAESGLEVVRYWMSKVSISGTTPADQRFTEVSATLQQTLEDAGLSSYIASSSESEVSFAEISLSNAMGHSFSAVLTKVDNDNIQVDVTGHYGALERKIRSNYIFGTRANTVFDYGVASKGPVALSGNVELEGVTIDVESNAYIESENTLLALSIIGNSHIAGTVKIVNPLAYVLLQGGHAGIGGVTGEDAIQEPYTTIGVAPAEFPEMVPAQFADLVTLTDLDPNMDTTADATLTNIRIPANTNPTFSGHATLQGLIWIETPNVVTFTGNADVTAVIVGDGDADDNSGVNQLVFQGDVDSTDVSTLTGFEDVDGTFVMAPGFHVSFGGSFSTLAGAIAANGIEFFGNAGGTIQGSIINYSDNEMTLSGNSDLYFNRSGLDEVPAGFVPEIILKYDGSAYSEII